MPVGIHVPLLAKRWVNRSISARNKMTEVTVSYGTTGCGSPACTLSASSHEPVKRQG